MIDLYISYMQSSTSDNILLSIFFHNVFTIIIDFSEFYATMGMKVVLVTNEFILSCQPKLDVWVLILHSYCNRLWNYKDFHHTLNKSSITNVTTKSQIKGDSLIFWMHPLLNVNCSIKSWKFQHKCFFCRFCCVTTIILKNETYIYPPHHISWYIKLK